MSESAARACWSAAFSGAARLRSGGNRRGTEQDCRAKPSIEITITECLPERGECGLAGAVSGCDVCNLVGIAKGCDDPVDLVVLGHDQMKPARNKMDARIDLRCGFHDLINAGMRAAHHDYHAVWRINGQRQLAQFQ